MIGRVSRIDLNLDAPPHIPMDAKTDPLVAVVMDPIFIDIASSLMARLDLVQYDETRVGVFKTKWGKQLFTTCVKRLSPALDTFDVDEWYARIIASPVSKKPDTRIGAAYGAQPMETNWLLPLFEMEAAASGFMRLLHNVTELEDKAHQKLQSSAKKEMEYDFFGVGPRNQTLCLEGPRSGKSGVKLIQS